MVSSYLFAGPSWLAGAARTLDLGAVFDDYNYALTPEQADYLALLADWSATGQDLWAALVEYEAQTAGEPLPAETQRHNTSQAAEEYVGVRR